MSRNPNRQRGLTGAAILSAGDGDHADGLVAGLFLRVCGCAASWVYRYRSPTSMRVTKAGQPVRRTRELGLGSAMRESETTAEKAAATARALALQHASAVMLGRDPAEEKIAERRARQQVAAAVIKQQARQRRALGAVIRLFHEREVEGAGTYTDKHAAAWISIFERHLKPYEASSLWNRPIDEVEPAHLLAFIKDLQKRVPHTARKARQRLDQVLEYSVLHKWCPANPAKAIVRAARRGAPAVKSSGFRAIGYRQIPDLVARLRASDSTASRCLLFTLLTASRTGEAIRAEWSEVDMVARQWLIPAARMKAGREHRVDLSDQALAILKRQEGLHDRWVFPSPTNRDQSLSNMSLLKQLERVGMRTATTTHGLRKAFSTWGNELGIARGDVIEAALAHREPDIVRKTYNLADFFAERKALLQKWADFAFGLQSASANEEQNEQSAQHVAA